MLHLVQNFPGLLGSEKGVFLQSGHKDLLHSADGKGSALESLCFSFIAPLSINLILMPDLPEISASRFFSLESNSPSGVGSTNITVLNLSVGLSHHL